MWIAPALHSKLKLKNLHNDSFSLLTCLLPPALPGSIWKSEMLETCLEKPVFRASIEREYQQDQMVIENIFRQVSSIRQGQTGGIKVLVDSYRFHSFWGEALPLESHLYQQHGCLAMEERNQCQHLSLGSPVGGSMLISAVCCFFLFFGNSESAMIGWQCLFCGASIAAWNALDVITVELYPTDKRCWELFSCSLLTLWLRPLGFWWKDEASCIFLFFYFTKTVRAQSCGLTGSAQTFVSIILHAWWLVCRSCVGVQRSQADKIQWICHFYVCAWRPGLQAVSSHLSSSPWQSSPPQQGDNHVHRMIWETRQSRKLWEDVLQMVLSCQKCYKTLAFFKLLERARSEGELYFGGRMISAVGWSRVWRRALFVSLMTARRDSDKFQRGCVLLSLRRAKAAIGGNSRAGKKLREEMSPHVHFFQSHRHAIQLYLVTVYSFYLPGE